MAKIVRRKFTDAQKASLIRKVQELVAGDMTIDAAVEKVGIVRSNYDRWKKAASEESAPAEKPAVKRVVKAVAASKKASKRADAALALAGSKIKVEGHGSLEQENAALRKLLGDLLIERELGYSRTSKAAGRAK